MRYVKIQNNGVAPLEALIYYGVSTTRYSTNDEAIGVYGSGSKHATLLLMRYNIVPTVFTGTIKVEPFTKTINVGGRLYQKICYRISGKDQSGRSIRKTEESTSTLEYGATDWTDLSFALREYVSNALDGQLAHTGKHDSIAVEIVEENQVRAKAGETRVFIPLTDEVRKVYDQLPQMFLHLGNKAALRTTLIPKDEPSPARVYKRGVFVRELKGYSPSLFDYNLAELELDESRNVNKSACVDAISRRWRDEPADKLVRLIQANIDGNLLESELDSYYLRTQSYETDLDERRREWQLALEAFDPNAVWLPCEYALLAEQVRRKGYKPLMVKDEAFCRVLKCYGARTWDDVLTADDRQGREILPATTDIQETLNEIWNMLELLGETHGRDKPAAACFKMKMEAESVVLGFYRDNQVYINTDIATGKSDQLWQTLLEEVAHHITQETDNSRSFQDYAFRLVTQLHKYYKGKN